MRCTIAYCCCFHKHLPLTTCTASRDGAIDGSTIDNQLFQASISQIAHATGYCSLKNIPVQSHRPCVIGRKVSKGESGRFRVQYKHRLFKIYLPISSKPPRAPGILPIKALSLTRNSRRLDRLPNWVGIEPDRELPFKLSKSTLHKTRVRGRERL
jgi:hypothetical protein